MQLTVKANAKINWALDILGRREDGYHEMDMLMHSIDLYDELSFSNAKWTTLSINGKLISNSGKNLIIKAASALNEYTGEKRCARIELKKRIPVRAGLGGGSADCAATLLALNELWHLRLPVKTLLKIGARLGADVPYCMVGGLCRVSGIGDVLNPLPGAKEAHLLIRQVGEGLSTQAVFAEFDNEDDGRLNVDIDGVWKALSDGDYSLAAERSGNALQRAAVRLLPEIQAEIDRLKQCGALYAQMSGSGSAVYGVFESEEAAKCAMMDFPDAFYAKTLTEPQILLTEATGFSEK